MKCIGKYCNVYLEDDVKANSNSTITKKSLLLDKFENPCITEYDPLGLKKRNYLSLDALILKNPHFIPQNFYLTTKVCKNCQLAYSIIDLQRHKARKTLFEDKVKFNINKSIASMQTKLSFSTKKFLDNINKLKKRIETKKKKEYNSMKNILIPVGQTQMSKDAKSLLYQLRITKAVDSEEEEQLFITKPNRKSLFVYQPEPCELAKSVLKKNLVERRNTRRLKASKTLPYIH
jgi:predicted RNA binding protein with dsRBD fold (UPF0201 family)